MVTIPINIQLILAVLLFLIGLDRIDGQAECRIYADVH